jgi:hypothetical protein
MKMKNKLKIPKDNGLIELKNLCDVLKVKFDSLEFLVDLIISTKLIKDYLNLNISAISKT